MSSHSDTLSWFRANQSFLFLLNDACLAEKQQPEQGEKLMPNTLIMFGFFIYRINSCSYSYPDLSRTRWLLNISKIYTKKISYQNRMESLIVSLDIHVSSIMMFVILHCFNLLYFSQIYIRKKVPVLSNHSL